jgi:hypothetical protein
MQLPLRNEGIAIINLFDEAGAGEVLMVPIATPRLISVLYRVVGDPCELRMKS